MTVIKKIAFILGILWSTHPVFSQSVLDKVNLFICTEGDHGQLDPSATVPWGMVKVGPDTEPGNHSGYDYKATKIKGFSHNRIGGVGCRGAGGNLRMLPGLGNTQGAATFRKSKEVASPAYYAVTFANEITAELTTTNQTAIHRYTFPESDKAFVNVDLESSFAELFQASYHQINAQAFTASISAKNVCNKGRYTVYYHVWCSKKAIRLNGTSHQLTLSFQTRPKEVVEFYVTTSSISSKDAEQEWAKVADKLTFDKALREGQQRWTEALSRIEVEGKQEYEILFYTHLYHMLLNPVRTMNSKGVFRATDGQLHTAKDYTHYDSWSMWDNFRNKFSLYSLLFPEVALDICHSLTDLYKYGKPTWSGYHEPVPTVRTEHSIVALLDFYTRGITDFDLPLVYRRFSAEIDNIPAHTPDTKLEKSYDYWALSEFARLLGKPDEQQIFLEKSGEYRETWKKYFSVMDEQSDVMHAKGLYEGTIWQYRWHVQFDTEGLVQLFGGKEKYTEQLASFFDRHLYNHGNQPDIHAPFMFNFGNKPWLTQKWVNQILTKKMYQYYGTHRKWKTPYYGHIYKATPAGYIPEMDDDEGTMSGWFVLSSIGLYPVEVGKPIFQISSPIFDRVVLHLQKGKTFEIITQNQQEKNFYIQNARLNGEKFNQTYIRHKDIVKGGKLLFELGNIPNKNWGTGH